jgi:hypothetical protein
MPVNDLPVLQQGQSLIWTYRTIVNSSAEHTEQRTPLLRTPVRSLNARLQRYTWPGVGDALKNLRASRRNEAFVALWCMGTTLMSTSIGGATNLTVLDVSDFAGFTYAVVEPSAQMTYLNRETFDVTSYDTINNIINVTGSLSNGYPQGSWVAPLLAGYVDMRTWNPHVKHQFINTEITVIEKIG